MKKKNTKLAKNALLFLPIPLIILSCIIYIFYSDLTILPSQNSQLTFSTYDDRVESGGKSTVNNQAIENKTVSVNFTLRKGYPFPFAGCQFRVDSVSHLLNLNPYKWMILEIDPSATTSNVHIILKENIKDFTTTTPLSERFHTYDLVLKPNQTSYKIPMDEFINPFWWYVHNSKSSKDLPDASKGRIAGINFESGSMLEINKTYNLKLNKIQFKKGPLLLYITIVFSIVYTCVLLTVYSLKKRLLISQPVLFHHDHLNIPNQSAENLNTIIKYIGSHYMEMSLSIQTVAKNTGIASEKITKTIKEHCNMTFRQYLNNIRITEAKRLLLESDRQVLDIALAVGYNSVNHFNKVFKLLMNCSPKEYRK